MTSPIRQEGGQFSTGLDRRIPSVKNIFEQCGNTAGFGCGFVRASAELWIEWFVGLWRVYRVGLSRSLTDGRVLGPAVPSLGGGSTGSRTRERLYRVMKRFRFAGVGVTVLAVLALSAMALASTASATTFLLAEFLENMVGITETMLVETTGEWLLENAKGPVGKVAMVCSEILVGDVGPNGAEDFTEVLNLSKELIANTALSELALLCTDETSCESSKMWAVGLPWLSLLELWEQGSESGFVTLLTSQSGGNIGWYIECTVLGVKGSEECTTAAGAPSATNVTGGVEQTFSEALTELMGLKLTLCSGNKEETGIVEGKGVTVTSLAGPLTVSE